MNILMTLANPFTHDPRVYNEAKSLVDAGHDITVLARDKKKKCEAIENKDGISVVRVSNEWYMNILPYNFFDFFLWWNQGYKKALELHKQKRFDAVHCHDFSSIGIGIKLKKKLGLPLIYDAHEIWGYMVSRNISWWRYYIHLEKKCFKM